LITPFFGLSLQATLGQLKSTIMNQNTILLLLICSISGLIETKAQTDLHGVTFGIGTGFNVMNKNSYSYSLSPDSNHALKMQKLPKGSFVISSVLSIKLTKLKVDEQTNQLFKAANNTDKKDTAHFWDRFSINVALNLLEINSDNVSFNKNIDGGLGIGYFLNDYVQVSTFLDLFRIRQLRDDIQNIYLNKPIPNGKEVFNALDEKNNDLFYNKTFTGFSFKVIFSLGNKKPETTK
jgi:hypothetical protein